MTQKYNSSNGTRYWKEGGDSPLNSISMTKGYVIMLLMADNRIFHHEAIILRISRILECDMYSVFSFCSRMKRFENDF